MIFKAGDISLQIDQYPRPNTLALSSSTDARLYQCLTIKDKHVCVHTVGSLEFMDA